MLWGPIRFSDCARLPVRSANVAVERTSAASSGYRKPKLIAFPILSALEIRWFTSAAWKTVLFQLEYAAHGLIGSYRRVMNSAVFSKPQGALVTFNSLLQRVAMQSLSQNRFAFGCPLSCRHNPDWRRNIVSRVGRLLMHTASFGLLMGLTAGCIDLRGGGGGPVIWAAADSMTLFPDSEPDAENAIFSSTARLLRLEAAVNETVSAQIAIRAGRSPLTITAVSMRELRQGEQVIAGDSIQLYRESRVPVTDYPAWFLRLTPELRAPRAYPDVLVPLTAARGGLPVEVPVGQTAALWLDVHVPLGAAPGDYRGTLQIAGRGLGRRDLDVSLSVWPFALPQTHHLALVAGLSTSDLLRQHLEVGGQPYVPARLSFEDPAYARAAQVIDSAVRLLHQHRCSPVLTDVYPLARLSPEGRPELDWADYDRLVSGILDGTLYESRTPALAWPMPVDDRNPLPDAYGGWGSASHRQAVAEYLRQSVEHFRDKGWLDRHYFYMPLPAGSSAARYDAFDLVGRLLLSVEPKLNILCPLPPQPMAAYGLREEGLRDVSTLVRTWCPPASMVDAEELRRQQALGRSAWFTPDRAPFAGSLSLLAPPLHARGLPWAAYRLGCSGLFLPSVNRWTGAGTPAAAESETALIWPGKPYGLNGPVPSIRLKRLLRGLQDYEYLWLLGQNRRPGIAELVAADLFGFGGTQAYGEHCLDGRPGGWVDDPAAWEMARRLMARELLAAFRESEEPASRPAQDEITRFEQQLEWARMTDATRALRAQVEGVRVEYDAANADAPFLIEATVALFNGTREPFGGWLSFADVPGQWRLDSSRLQVDRLDARRSARRILSGRVPGLVPNADGVLPIQLALTGANNEPRPFPARICAITSQRLTRPLVLDGKLDDWPLGAGNVAADFVLVGALDVPKQGRGSRDRASQQTLVFVCNDSNYLYIGFNCSDDRPEARVRSRGNAVRYDELWPTGEDLIEVVLDPTHRAVDAGDLLHFVVKSNGAVISERGAPCLAAVARYSDWPAGVEAAIDDTLHPDRWTVEMRIPIRALAGRPGIWGVNFGRYLDRLGEYSSWSGARRHLYSPASLGNLRVDY